MPIRLLPLVLLISACSAKTPPQESTIPPPPAPAIEANAPPQTTTKPKETPLKLDLSLPKNTELARTQKALTPQQEKLPDLFNQTEDATTTIGASPTLKFDEESIVPSIDGGEVHISVPLD